MKLQPRQQVLDIWEATARTSFQNDKWLWGGRHGTNSISDAEQLLCILTPATDVPAFRIDKPDGTSDDVMRSLDVFGDSVAIPRLLVRVLTEYMERYSTDDGTPIFAGESYFQPPDGQGVLSDASRALEVVDSFSASVTLSLATIGFVRVFKEAITREEIRDEVNALEALASRRLSAAMVGLLRSFTISVFDAHSPDGQALCRTVNQNGLPVRRIIADLRCELREINARLRDITIGLGSGNIAEELENPNRLFECGWSWGIVRGAPEIETPENVGFQREGYAYPAPYLYFTVVALDGIEALSSPRTRLLGLLNEEQTRLANALQIRWDLTQQYWQTIATFGTGTWPLEDIPWRTVDRLESDYFSLLVTSIAVQDLIRRRVPDAVLNRVGKVLVELAQRARITRRAFENNDPAMHLHAPGLRMDLLGDTDDGDFRLGWAVSDFAPLLLKRTVRVAGLMRDTELRSQLLDLADEVWDHLLRRRITGESGLDLWDQPGNAFDQIPLGTDNPSWYYTRRVVECLVTAATDVVTSTPLNDSRLSDLVDALLSEAEYRLDQELLRGSTEAGPPMRKTLDSVQATLRRVSEIIETYPGTAFTLVSEVLRDLDRLEAARSDHTRGGP